MCSADGRSRGRWIPGTEYDDGTGSSGRGVRARGWEFFPREWSKIPSTVVRLADMIAAAGLNQEIHRTCCMSPPRWERRQASQGVPQRPRRCLDEIWRARHLFLGGYAARTNGNARNKDIQNRYYRQITEYGSLGTLRVTRPVPRNTARLDPCANKQRAHFPEQEKGLGRVGKKPETAVKGDGEWRGDGRCRGIGGINAFS